MLYIKDMTLAETDRILGQVTNTASDKGSTMYSSNDTTDGPKDTNELTEDIRPSTGL
jgi:hypothetical protein